MSQYAQEVKLFGKWSFDDIEVGLPPWIALPEARGCGWEAPAMEQAAPGRIAGHRQPAQLPPLRR